MKLKDLLLDLDIEVASRYADLEITGISCDSKNVNENNLFVAIKGTKQDGHKFISEAISKGAKVVIVENNQQIIDKNTEGVLVIKLNNTRKVISQLAARFYNSPSKKIKVIGITGTNGKTTVAYLIDKILTEAGFATGLIGTIKYKFKNQTIAATNTTPSSLELQSHLHQMLTEGLKYCVMEVSSHSLDQERVADIDFSAAIFTNLTQDHLDYHLNLENYFLSKAKLFKQLNSNSQAIINIDSPYGERIIDSTQAKSITFGIDNKADIMAKDIKLDSDKSRFICSASKGDLLIETKLIGRHNVHNILAAVGLAILENIDFDILKAAIRKVNNIPGRLEGIDSNKGFKVFIDYAHTEDALKNVLTSLRTISKSRIIVVFGCGGDRDKDKRPKMGKVAARLSDFVILTTDNPRSEDPQDIINDIRKGIDSDNYKVILDRAKAIDEALSLAKTRDIVLIAGKGHEKYQIFKDKTVDFDDRKVVEDILKCSLSSR